MALEYTHSPLGLVPYSTIKDPEDQTEFKYYFKPTEISNQTTSKGVLGSVFSNKSTLVRYNGGSKHFGTHPLTLGSVSDTHKDEIYNVSTQNIIEKLNDYASMRLKWGDFAYCRDFGVYPNNRLVICRRFSAPISDDLTFLGKDGKHVSPISTLISWFDDQSNPLSFNVGEEWTESDVSFKELLNEAGNKIGLKGQFQLGDLLFSGANLIPLPGASEGLQRIILGGLGFIDPKDTKTISIIPSGTPNLIKESKRRKTLKEDVAGSTLKGSFSIQVKCAWEQKFIAGIDPTLVYYDILQTILSFAGSEAVFYLGKKSNLGFLDQKLQEYLEPGGAAKIVKDVVKAFKEALSKFKDQIKTFIKDAIDSSSSSSSGSGGILSMTKSAVKGVWNTVTGNNQTPQQTQASKDVEDAQNKVLGLIDTFVQTVIKSYRVQALGIVTSLTGLPSTPWHITIGNPLRPFFSSGDMYTSDVTVNLGPQLAYNDLPSFIEATFTLTSARNSGIDEIMTKLTCGAVRVTSEAPSFWNRQTQMQVDEESEAKDPAQTLIPSNENTLYQDDEFTSYAKETSTVNSTNSAEEDVKTSATVTGAEALASGTTGTQSATVAGATGEFPGLMPEFVVEAQRTPASSGATGEAQSKVGAEPQSSGQVANPQPPAAQVGPQGAVGGTAELNGAVGVQGAQENTLNSPPTTPSNVRKNIQTDVTTGTASTSNSSTLWQVGKIVAKGAYNYNTIRVEWYVAQSNNFGKYTGFVEDEDMIFDYKYDSLDAARTGAKTEAEELFVAKGGVL